MTNSKEVIITSFIKTLKEFGFRINDEYIVTLMGPRGNTILKKLLTNLKINYSEELIAKLDKKRAKIESELSNQIKLNKGSYDILRILKGQIKLALASMNNKIVLKEHLRNCKIENILI